MAELNTAPKGGGKKGRSKKPTPAVDLTAMVDLAFLLITFFMLTTTLSKPQSMDLAMPDKDEVIDEDNKPAETPAWRTLTIVLGEDDKVVHYIGSLENPQPGGEPTITAYGKNGIRQVILSKAKSVESDPRRKKADEGLVVIIKPSEKANYKNFVDILDEMAITQEKRYAVVDMTDADVQMLIEKGAY
ncbi:MAG TPA: biopolymer transporter ExbD [Flavobacterium sp.]|nr:biopolymer transporter ExbD [Flavobacterium sp.]